MNAMSFIEVLADVINGRNRCYRASQAADHEVGRRAGRAWATTLADDYELRHIARLARGVIEVPTDGDSGTWLATQMGEAFGFNRNGQHYEYRARCVLFADPDAIHSREYVCGFVSGATEVWQQLRTKDSPRDA